MKKCICFIGLSLIMMLAQNAYALKKTIIDLDQHTDTETNFFDADRKKVFLDQYEGKAVLLVFWATWCGTCVNDLEALDNLAKDFRKLPFKVIALSEDSNGIEVVTKYFAEQEIRHLEIFHDYKNQLFRAMSIRSLPTAFLINSDGKIKKLFKGRMKWQNDEIRAILLDEIEGNPEMPKNSYKAISLNRKASKPISATEPDKKQNNKLEGTNNEQQTNE